ncbi:MAG: hypothetical protein A2275_01695 [Bacteroidetes bacterium RIFOXYA12_FULL_35_11]|nr:MAG: hypothetical protein A2X01_19985 [Bacteroidetes bacterium GWF2_35_48]OFY76830.1 MAG: hypothetical protein A2275_01695 [Bacteroidetes bacterium RIFOXYA12_FULL_35_11]OFY92714.1 MAG: hypothetical protein A2309_04100 [Bacteroidetes bacterium RIFOXYB2_FULL_35_7]OFZ00115.1 MAG: hypothetical protein A2491_19360 [Bacteroidetes bacterium RIFOXYC12_FULL_35_7]
MISFGISFSQTTEKEKDLLKQNTDTTQGWKKGGVVTITFSQISLTNWSAGGQNSISGNGLVNIFANYKMGNKSWDNTLNMGYGLLRQGKKKTTLLKSDDKIELNSKFGQKVTKAWYVAALMNLKTQFSAGYNYPNDSVAISDFFAPAAFITAIGMDYKPIPDFTAFIAPVTGRVIIVNSETLADAGAYGVEKALFDETTGNLIKHGKKARYEFGGYLRAMYTRELKKDVVKLTTKLDLFSNYLDCPENVDVNWEVLIAMKLGKYLTATISTTLIYDDNTKIKIDKDEDGIIEAEGPRIQFKEVFGLGFSYKF